MYQDFVMRDGSVIIDCSGMLKQKFDGERWGWEQRVKIQEVEIMVPSGWS